MRSHWDSKAAAWDAHLPSSELFGALLDVILEHADPQRRDVVIDLGAGTGFLTLPFAERTRRVYAVDHSRAMLSRFGEETKARGLPIVLKATDVRQLRPPEPADIVVSNYALHHLSHPAKRRLVEDSLSWLKPGGRMLVSDLMVPLTLRPGQSGPLLAKVRSIARRGPAGYWRIAKNGARWVTGRGEYPASREFWMRTLEVAGFVDVDGRAVGVESGVVWGRKPGGPT